MLYPLWRSVYVQVRPYLFALSAVMALVCHYSCANRVPPTGGAKDTVAPRFLGATPPNGSLNVPLNSRITLRFDEFTELQNANTILISPLVEKQPDFKLRGKTVTIAFKEPLRLNTTYTVFFGENLKDVNEGNVLHGYEYTFSTGSTRDTLFFKGKVLLAANNQVAKDALVMLYEGNSADTAFLTTRPLYITRSDDKGQFRLSNIGAGKYRIFAIIDQNNNYYYDQPNEQIAFSDSLINIAASAIAAPTHQPDSTATATAPDTLHSPLSVLAPLLTLRLFSEGKEKPQIAEKQVREYGRSLILFTQPIDSLRLTALDSLLAPSDWLQETTPRGDTATVWYRNIPEATALSFEVRGAKEFADTVRFKQSPALKTIQPLKFTSSVRMGRGNASFDLNKPVWIEFTAPLVRFDTAMVQLTADSLPISLAGRLSFDPNYPRRLRIDYAWRGEVQYEVTLPDSTATDFWGQTNEEMNLKFKAQAQNRYGTVLLRCIKFDAAKSYIFQLRDSKGEKIILQAPLQSAQTQWEQINASAYRVFIIEDRNKNGKWDSGNYLQRLQPEPIYTSRDLIEVKGNWDTEVEMRLQY